MACAALTSCAWQLATALRLFLMWTANCLAPISAFAAHIIALIGNTALLHLNAMATADVTRPSVLPTEYIRAAVDVGVVLFSQGAILRSTTDSPQTDSVQARRCCANRQVRPLLTQPSCVQLQGFAVPLCCCASFAQSSHWSASSNRDCSFVCARRVKWRSKQSPQLLWLCQSAQVSSSSNNSEPALRHPQ